MPNAKLTIIEKPHPEPNVISQKETYEGHEEVIQGIFQDKIHDAKTEGYAFESTTDSPRTGVTTVYVKGKYARQMNYRLIQGDIKP